MLQDNDQNRDSSKPVEQPTPTPQADPQEVPTTTLNDEALEAARKEGWRDCAMAEIEQQHKADQSARNDPALRMEMCRLIDHLSNVLDDHAHALCHEESDIGAFNLDIKKDLLTWQLAEFLCRAYLERDPVEPPIVRGWQVDQPHAFDFFRVDVYGDCSLVALEVEAPRK